ncbi:long-chain fatty acid--CoA ligase [Nostoc punctiforme UO1]|uniref:class I adenylate-forming enzyme family protein n=1 Tax=Nostoc punctiforme TaxID=272131 RepID=UPI0030B5FD31
MLNQLLFKTVKAHPEKTAIVYDNRRMKYNELYSQVIQFSKALNLLNVKQGDCVAIVLPNCPEFIVSFYAITQLKAIALPLNPAFQENEISFYINDTDASVIITDLAQSDVCCQVISQIDRKIELIIVDGVTPSSLSFDALIQKETDEFQEIETYEGYALYQYSSGTTEKPKRLCRTQKNIFHQANNTVSTLNVTVSDTILCIVPMFHAYGFGECLLAATSTGATLVILEQFIQDSVPVVMPFVFRCPRILNLIKSEKITILPGVPYIYSILAATPYQTPADFSSLRLCISAGNFLPKDTFDKFLKRFGMPIRQLYGFTEAGTVAINLSDPSDLPYDSIGWPINNVEIKVIDDKGNELPSDVIGEFVIKSESLITEYNNLTKENKELFKNGYFFTSDLGKKDEQNRLYLTGRKKILIYTESNRLF